MSWHPETPPVDPAPDLLLTTLGYWLDVEALTPPGAEEDGETDASGSFRATWYPDRDFPWGMLHRPPDRTFRHFVRCGIFGREAYDAALVRCLAVLPEEDHDTRPPVTSRRFGFAGVFAADHDGLPLPDSLRLPAFALAFAKLRVGAPADLDAELEEFRRGLQAAFNDLAAPYLRDRQPVDAAFLDTLRELVAEPLPWLAELGAGAPLAIIRTAVASVITERISRTERHADGTPKRVRRERHRQPELPPLDSFYFEDLRRLHRAVRQGNAGLLAPFIQGTATRIDCTAPGFLAAACDAVTHPPARWPAGHDLALMQQVAVDLATRHLAGGGLFSVNGPPGTGKTTLFMDLVAAVLARRAEDLCAFAHPAEAFVPDKWTIAAGPSAGPVHALRRRLLDHLIVVASSNNGAVENITRELPDEARIAPAYREEVAFFAATAAALRQRPPPDDEEEGEDGEDTQAEPAAATDEARAWGLVSAVLGKRRNRERFVATLLEVESQGPRRGHPAPGNIWRALAEARRTADWPAARQAFLTELARVRALQQEIASLDQHAAARASALAELATLPERLAQAEQGVAAADAARIQATADAVAAEAAFRRADRGAELLRLAKPAWFRLIAAARWQRDYAAAVATRATVDQALGVAEAGLRQARITHDNARGERDAIQARIGICTAQQEAATAAIAAITAAHPGLVTAAVVAAAPDRQRQQMLPGTSQPLREARARLFGAALRVHCAFVCAAGEFFDRNLALALDLLQGRDGVQGGAHPGFWCSGRAGKLLGWSSYDRAIPFCFEASCPFPSCPCSRRDCWSSRSCPCPTASPS